MTHRASISGQATFVMQGWTPLLSIPAILLLPLLLILPKTVWGCNERTIVLKPKLDGKGNWVLTNEKCRTCQDSRDEGSNNTLPPPVVEATTTTPSEIPNTPIPIGDCECGQGIKWEKVAGTGGVEQLNRPWMVHFR